MTWLRSRLAILLFHQRCQTIKNQTARVDWHYSGGRANVLHLGDNESRQRVLNVIEELKGELDGHILSVDGPALYRAGDEVPAGTIAMDPDLGSIVVQQ